MDQEDNQNYTGPYWRSNGAIFIVMKSLEEIDKLLNYMFLEAIDVDEKLEKHYEKYSSEESTETDEALE